MDEGLLGDHGGGLRCGLKLGQGSSGKLKKISSTQKKTHDCTDLTAQMHQQTDVRTHWWALSEGFRAFGL